MSKNPRKKWQCSRSLAWADSKPSIGVRFCHPNFLQRQGQVLPCGVLKSPVYRPYSVLIATATCFPIESPVYRLKRAFLIPHPNSSSLQPASHLLSLSIFTVSSHNACPEIYDTGHAECWQTLRTRKPTTGVLQRLDRSLPPTLPLYKTAYGTRLLRGLQLESKMSIRTLST